MKVFMDVITTLGHGVVIPIIIFTVALALRVSLKTAVMSAILVGVALTGFGWVITTFTPVVTKTMTALVQTTGLNLPVADTGWQGAPLTAFKSTVGISFFLLGLIAEVILFFIGYTKVFFATNLWQNWGFMIWGTIAYVSTGNFYWSLSLCFFLLAVALVLAEVQADRYASYYQVANGTTAAMHNIESVIPALIFDPLWNFFGLQRCALTPGQLKQKLGLLGEPTMIGACLGLALGGLANLKHLGQLEGWAKMLTFSIELATVMTLFPLIAKLFGQAFRPLTKEITHRYQNRLSASGKKQKKTVTWFIAVDDGLGYGEEATLIGGMVLMPILLVVALLLPGNKMLPLVDLIALPFMLESIVAIHQGNLVKVLATGTVWFTLGLYAGSYMAPWYTEALQHFGVLAATSGALVVSYNVMARPVTTLIFIIWLSGNWLLITALLTLYCCAWLYLRINRDKIWHYLQIMADKNTTKKL